MELQENKPGTKPGFDAEHDTSRTFPLPGTTYYNMLYDPKSKKQFYTSFKMFNTVIAPLYRLGLLPLVGFGKLVIVLTTRGRKSGKMRRTPIGYFRYEGQLYVISGWGKDANWYKNILAYPNDVYVQAGFRHFHACAEIVTDREELHRLMKWLVLYHTTGAEAKAMGWDPKRDNAETADFSGMFEKMVIVRLLEQPKE
jgi:deazaflavin-dependent oxidoreductase (nitroreductase family)